MEYVRSNRGAFKLIHGNHVYVKQKVLKNGAICWECEQRRNKVACKAKLHVLNDQIVKNVNEHTHPANRGEVESIKVRQAMKKRARETEETPQQIIHCPQHQHVKNTSSHVFGFMPPQNGFFKSHQMTKVCHNHALPLYLLVFCKICTRTYCDFVPVICVLFVTLNFVTCKLCDL